MGILFGSQIGLANTAREVARYASTVPPNSSAAAVAQVNRVLPGSVLAYNGSAVPTASYCYYQDAVSPATYSWKVIVQIQYGHTLFVPLVGVLIDAIDGTSDNRFTTTVREEMRVETQPIKSVPSGAVCGVNP
jgi:hypothetical protein